MGGGGGVDHALAPTADLVPIMSHRDRKSLNFA